MVDQDVRYNLRQGICQDLYGSYALSKYNKCQIRSTIKFHHTSMCKILLFIFWGDKGATQIQIFEIEFRKFCI